jgi:hypothetical protein
MNIILKKMLLIASLGFLAHGVQAAQFVVELPAPLEKLSSDLLSTHSIKLDQTFSGGADSYAVFSSPDQEALVEYLVKAQINAEKVSAVLFVNSPVIGGGEIAGKAPREGHTVFVIERPIPGVGFFGLEKKQKISKESNAAIAKLGNIIEWDHSYLTGEGTYCVYRADSPDTLREHGALAGAPIGKITPVEQKSF